MESGGVAEPDSPLGAAVSCVSAADGASCGAAVEIGWVAGSPVCSAPGAAGDAVAAAVCGAEAVAGAGGNPAVAGAAEPGVPAVAPTEEAPPARRAGAAGPFDLLTKGGAAAPRCDKGGAGGLDPAAHCGEPGAGDLGARGVAGSAVAAGAASAAACEAAAGGPDGGVASPAAFVPIAGAAASEGAVAGIRAASTSNVRTQLASSSITAGVPLSLKEYVCPSASRASLEPRRKAASSLELSGSEMSSNCPFGMLARPSNGVPSSSASLIAARVLGVNCQLGLIRPSHHRYPTVSSTNKFIPLS